MNLSLVLDTLLLRRPPLDYVSPPICALFSSTGFPVIVIEPIPAQLGPTGPVLGGVGKTLFNWNSYPKELCWSILTATDPNNPDSPYNIVSDCVPPHSIGVCSAGWFEVTALTQVPGGPVIESAPSSPFLSPGGGTTIIPLPQYPNTFGYNLYKNPVLDEPNGTYTLYWNNFNGNGFEICQTGCYKVQVITGDGPTPPSGSVCTPILPGNCTPLTCGSGTFFLESLCECVPCSLFGEPCPVGEHWDVALCECVPVGPPGCNPYIDPLDVIPSGNVLQPFADFKPGGVVTGCRGDGSTPYLYFNRTQASIVTSPGSDPDGNPGTAETVSASGLISGSPAVFGIFESAQSGLFYETWTDVNGIISSVNIGDPCGYTNIPQTTFERSGFPGRASNDGIIAITQNQTTGMGFGCSGGIQQVLVFKAGSGTIATIGDGITTNYQALTGGYGAPVLGTNPNSIGKTGNFGMVRFPPPYTDTYFSFWTSGGGLTDYPQVINGGSWQCIPNGAGDAMLYVGGDGTQNILFSGGSFSAPFTTDAAGANWSAMNDSRVAVGVDSNTHPFMWDQINGVQPIPLLPGATIGIPTGITNAGIVVGYSDLPTNGAWIYISGVLFTLQSKLQPSAQVNWTTLDTVQGMTDDFFTCGFGTFNGATTGYAAQFCFS